MAKTEVRTAYRGLRRALAGCLVLAALDCAAQSQAGKLVTDPLENEPSRLSDQAETWDIRLGLVGAVGPEYEGASTYEVEPVAFARIGWRDLVIFRGRSLDLNLYHENGVRFGPMIKTRGGRDEDNRAAFDGYGDVDRAWEVGGFVRYNPAGPTRVRVNVLQDVAGAHDGLVVEMSGAFEVPFEKGLVNLTVSSTWGNNDFISNRFGVSASQARRSLLPRFDADAGFKEVGVVLGGGRKLTRHWSLVASAGYTRLLGDAADSPIIDDYGSANQYVVACGVMFTY